MFDINTFKDTYRGKTVLVTGHTGFKGSVLSTWLTKLGANVVGFSDKYPCDNNGIQWLSNSIVARRRVHTEFMMDIRDYHSVKYVMEYVKPDIVFHLAAQALVKTAYDNPRYTFETNVMGTMNVLDAYVNYVKNGTAGKPTALVCITSDKCYQNVEQMWGYRETDRMGGDDPYSASKGCAELIINAYMKSDSKELDNYMGGIASVRAGNVIGGGDCSLNRLIPDCVRSICNNTNIVLRNPFATRPWLHVFEPLSGYMRVAQCLYNEANSASKTYSTNFNFGPKIEDNKTVGEVVQMFVSNFNTDIKLTCEKDTTNQHECGLLNLDVTKAYRMLDWSRRWDIEKSLQKTAEWYKAMINKEDMYNITIKQIEEYCNS